MAQHGTSILRESRDFKTQTKLHYLMSRSVIFILTVFPLLATGQVVSSFYMDGVLEEKRTFEDTVAFTSGLTQQKIEWINQGFLFAGVDSIVTRDSELRTYLHKGQQVDVQLNGLRKKKLLKQVDKKLSYLNSHGYPFATLRLDSLLQKVDGLAGSVVIQRGPEIKYDSAFFFKETRTKHRYIYRILDVVPGEQYSEATYELLDKRIKRSPFLSLNRSPDLSFSKNLAKVYLDIEESISNTFEGVAGLQQKANGETALVGSLDLSIQNLFQSGHEFQFQWESFAEASQTLDLYYQHAFLFDAKILPSFRFTLLKQDTSFLTRTTGIGLSTYVLPRLSMLIEYENTNGSLISSDLETVQNRNLADFSRDFYRLAISSGFFEGLNGFNNGLAWNLSVGAGSKSISRNVGLPDSYYDTLNLQTNFLKVDARVGYQLKVGKRQSIYHDIHLGFLENDEVLTNELYRVGGLQSLRGFNEKNFFAQYYSLSRLELRSFFENSSFIYAFYDQLLFDRVDRLEAPLGIGFGFALETLAGQFKFAVAGGNSKNQAISFPELRIHFGYLSRF